MNDEQLKQSLKSMGMKCFVDYFDRFNDKAYSSVALVDLLMREKGYAKSASRTRVHRARRIIAAGRAVDALQVVAHSTRISGQTAQEASRLASSLIDSPRVVVIPRVTKLEFRMDAYVPHLVAMHEQPLHPAVADRATVYRLLLTRTEMPPVMVRLTEANKTWHVVCKRSNGIGELPGRLVFEKEHDLLPADAKQFDTLLSEAVFWDMPSSDAPGLDGGWAMLEGVSEGRYHAVERWSPRGTPYAKLVDFLIKLCRS